MNALRLSIPLTRREASRVAAEVEADGGVAVNVILDPRRGECRVVYLPRDSGDAAVITVAVWTDEAEPIAGYPRTPKNSSRVAARPAIPPTRLGGDAHFSEED